MEGADKLLQDLSSCSVFFSARRSACLRERSEVERGVFWIPLGVREALIEKTTWTGSRGSRSKSVLGTRSLLSVSSVDPVQQLTLREASRPVTAADTTYACETSARKPRIGSVPGLPWSLFEGASSTDAPS
jgi:hypothetical protein